MENIPSVTLLLHQPTPDLFWYPPADGGQMGQGWEQRNAALPLTAVEAMQLASPGQLSDAFWERGQHDSLGH